MRNKIWLLWIPFLMCGCEKSTDEKFSDVNQQVLFQIEYTNWAWGKQHYIMIIDSSGVVTKYDLPAIWNHPNSDSLISLSDMNENISQNGEIECKVSKSKLLKYFSKLDEAKKGDISAPESRMRDAGGLTYSGFLYDPSKEMYREVFIRQWGDISIENESREADEIYKWMITISKIY